MRLPKIIRRLRGRQVTRLQRIYRETDCPRTRIRIQMVLLSNQGRHPAEIAAITQQSDDTVRRWLQRFEDEGCTGLIERLRSGRPPQITDVVDQFLWQCMHKIRAPGVSSPKRHECAATDWRKGHILHVRSEKRDAATFCHLLDRCVKRSELLASGV